METRTIYKLFFVWEYEREERWLNEMALSGWVLERVGFCKYVFAPCTPGEYTIRLELHQYDEEYLAFLREMNVEYIGHMVSWLYARKKTADGDFALFSDLDSRVDHLKRIGRMLTVLMLANFVLGLVNNMGRGMGFVNLLVAALLAYALGHIHEKKAALTQSRTLHE